MTRIPKEVQEFMKDQLAWCATAATDGVPNTTPKGTVRIIDEEHIAFADLFSRKTRTNLQENPHVAITFIDEKSHKGYQIKGSAQMLASGPLFDQIATELKKAPNMPPLKYVVNIKVDAIFDQSVGQEAGKQIV